jgi:heptosyltransferase-2
MIGDLVLITPAIATLKKAYPDCRISIIVREYAREVVDGHPLIDEVIVDRIVAGRARGIRGYLDYVKEIRELNFDVGINYFNEMPYALLMLWAGIPYRVGDVSRFLHGWMYNCGVFQHWRDYTRHEIEQNLELLSPLGVADPDPQFSLHIDPAAAEKAKDLLKAQGIGEKDLLIGVHPGTGGGNKTYWPEYYARAVSQLIKKFGAKVILTGGPAEAAAAEKIMQLSDPQPINLVNKTTLSEFIALLKRLNLYIGVDTGPLHIAAGFKVPIVALFPTKAVKPTKWGPWGTRHVILHHPWSCKLSCFPKKCGFTDCQKSIEPEEIVEAAGTLLAGEGLKTHQEAFTEWVRNSFNILLVGRMSPELDFFYNELSLNGFHAVKIDYTPDPLSLIKLYGAEDINIVHQLGNFGTIRLVLSHLLSGLFLFIPVLLIRKRNLGFKSLKEIIGFYIKEFRSSIL